jgi:outer membrane lipoprotein SlyB
MGDSAMKSFLRASIAVCIAMLGLGSAACAADAPAAAASRPDARALAKLCDTCGVVASVATEKRKGKASGLGAVGGAVAGGVLGHQMGGGTGKTVATAGGAVAGGLIGNEIEKRMHKHTVWMTTVTMKDETSRRFEAAADPGLKAGDVVKVDNGQMRRAP